MSSSHASLMTTGARRRRRSIAFGISALLTFVAIPLIWFSGGAFDVTFSFTGVEVTFLGACAACCGGALAGVAIITTRRPSANAAFIGYAAGLANTAFALMSYAATETISGVLPTPGDADVLGVRTGPAIAVLLVAGVASTIAGLDGVVRPDQAVVGTSPPPVSYDDPWENGPSDWDENGDDW